MANRKAQRSADDLSRSDWERLIVGLAKQMINNGDLILRTEKLMAQTKNLKHSYAMDLIQGGRHEE